MAESELPGMLAALMDIHSTVEQKVRWLGPSAATIQIPGWHFLSLYLQGAPHTALGHPPLEVPE